MKYISVQKIAQVRLLCRKVLPAVYDESLSYLEGLSKLSYKLNETIESVNALNDNVDVLNDSVTELNARVEAVEGEISGFEAEITAQFNALESNINASVDAKLAEVDTKLGEVDSRIDAIEDSIDGKFEAINQQITVFENTIVNRINALEKELKDLINDELVTINEMYQKFEADMKYYVDEKLKEAISQIPDLQNVLVIDPTTGLMSKIQVVVDNIVKFAAYYAFTCDEYNELGLSCDELNDIMVKSIPRGMTCYEWLREAKKVLLEQVDTRIAEKFAYPHSFVLDYLDGRKVWHDRNVDVNQMLIAASGCYSCDELETLAFTCDEIVDFAVSCFQFVMRANKLMVRTA